MVTQLSFKDIGKSVIDALREGKKSWSDFKQLKVSGREIPDKSLDRLLKCLDYWSLASKESDSGYWVWYEKQRKVFKSDGDYLLAIEHSRKLIPALNDMINASFKFRGDLYPYAEEHLKSYPEIFDPMQEFGNIFNDKNKERLQKYDPDAKLAGSDPFMLIPIIPKLKLRNSRETLKSLDLLKPYLDLYREFAGRLCELKLKIDMGEPLQGVCNLCPKVTILDQKT